MNFIKSTLKGALVLTVVIAIVLLITLLTPITIGTASYLTFVFIGFSYLLGMLMEQENR